MMIRNIDVSDCFDSPEIGEDYFLWLYSTICFRRVGDRISYMKTLRELHSIEYIPMDEMDENRIYDGVYVRQLYSNETGNNVRDIFKCSILELIVGLSYVMETSIMDDPAYGDRTIQWIWGMIHSLGLGSMTDEVYDKDILYDIIYRFLNKEYEPNGSGSLFRLFRTDGDCRSVDIWTQMCWYLAKYN